MKFYFDEDSAQHRLVAALRSHAIDVVTCLDAGMNARDDESHLILATEQGRVLISANAGDFASLHRQEHPHKSPHNVAEVGILQGVGSPYVYEKFGSKSP